MRSAVVCGVPVDDVTLDEALDRVGALVERGRTSGRSHQVATVNVDFLVHAMEDPTLLSLLQRVDLALPDGMPVVWGSRLLGIPLRERVAGSDLVPALAARCARDGHAMYLLGGAPGVAERAAALLRERHPELRVDGDSGLVVTTPEDTDAAVLERIRAHRPDVLCVALGHPKQERWIHHHRDVLGVPVMVGVGASLDFLTGTQQRAPSWMQRTGTEWLHRAIREPGRLGPRYAHDLVRFGPQLAREARLSRPSSAADAAPTVVERRGQVTLVRPGGRLELDAALLGWNEQTWPEPPPGHHVVVDLAERTSLDQQEITALVLLARRLEASGGAVTLTSVAEPVARRLLDRRLYGLLRVSSYPVALEALIGSTDVAPDGWLPPGMRARASERRSTHA